MTRTVSGFVLAIAFGYGAQTAYADLYGYVDEDGRTHVSNQKLNERYQLIQRTAPVASKAPVSSDNRTENVSAAPTESLPKIGAAGRKKYASLIKHVAQRYNVEAALIHAIISVESAYDARAVSPRGATGLMQLMPDTAGQYGVLNMFDPRQNIIAGTKHLRYLMKIFDNDLALALAAYNAGHNTVLKYGAIPPITETRNYVPRVLGYYQKYRGEI